MKDTPQNDRSEYVDTGMRDGDTREGFGDDGGTRVGRPDGAGSNASPQDPQRDGHHAATREAPRDASGPQRPGQAGTNTSPVPGGIEGSQMDGEEATDAQGQQQSRVQAASGSPGGSVNPERAAGDDRRVDDL